MFPPAVAPPVTLLALLALLALAVRSDLLWHRIPNLITGLGLAAGLVLQATLAGWEGVRSGLLGAAAGCAVLLPFYLLRGMGAGDVKLAGAAGSYLGPAGALFGAFASLVAGAICALIWSIAVRRRLAAVDGSPGPAELRKQKFPYALAIALGMLGSAAAQWPTWAT